MVASKQVKVIVLILLGIILIGGQTAVSPLNAQTVEPDPFAEIYKQVEASGQYHFVANIEQALIPRPTAVNIGKSEERVDTFIRGDVTLPDSALLILQFEGGVNVPPITLEQDGNETFLIHEGERKEIENPLGVVAPNNDFLGYLRAARDIQVKPESPHPDLTIYTFEIDGPAYAEYVRENAQRQLPEGQRHKLLSPSPILQGMTGQGELWVDNEGYPRRQIIDVYIPEVNEQFHSQAYMEVDYVIDEPLQGVASLSPESLLSESASLAADHSVTANPLETIAPKTAVSPLSRHNIFLLFFLIVLILFAILLIRPPRWARSTVIFLLVGIFIVSPLLQVPIHAQKSEQAPQTLTAALGIEQSVEQENEEVVLQLPPSNIQQQVVNESCGTGDTVTDSDFDGTTDFVERCLGTAVYYIDSDGDHITDTLEIDGFSYNSQTWYLNPAEPDSNFDGLTDYYELPTTHGGLAPNLDDDNDGVPNIWDEDNDGDGVRDELDLDPFYATGYVDSFSLDTTLDQSTFDGYQYIEIQVQPEDLDHLRYVNTTLDWLYDEEGNIQDLDASKEDLTLLPYLKVETIGRPSDNLIEEYNISFSQLGNVGSGWQPISNRIYELYIPLSPVSEGGQITAFEGRIVYDPGTFDEVSWEDIQLIWFASMANDSYNDNDEVVTENTMVAQYSDPFRVVGLQVTKSSKADYALFGTPAATNETDLFQLLFSLEQAYLGAANNDLDAMVARFENPSTPITQTWGIPASEIAVTSPTGNNIPAHLDDMLTAVATDLDSFLNDNNYDTSLAVVGLMTEVDIGASGLDVLDLPEDEGNVDGPHFSFNLADIPLNVSRSLNTYNLAKNGGAWEELADESLWQVMETRYSDLSATLATLQLTYPDIEDENELYTILYALLQLWNIGNRVIVEFDGNVIVPETIDDSEIYALYGNGSDSEIFTYLITTLDLATEGSGLNSFDANPDVFYEGLRRSGGQVLFSSINSLISRFFTLKNIANTGITSYFGATSKAWGVSLKGAALKLAGDLPESTLRGMNLAGSADDIPVPKKLKFAQGLLKHSAKIGKAIAIIGIIVGVLLFGYELYNIWSAYDNYSSPYAYERTYALVYAIVATVLAVIFLILSFFAAGVIILLVFALLSAVIALIGLAFGEDLDLTNILIMGIISAVWTVDAYTRFLDFNFDELESDVSEGLVKGASIIFSDSYEGYIYLRKGSENRLDESYSYGYFGANGDSSIAVDTYQGDRDCSGRIEHYVIDGLWYGPTQECTNNLFAAFTFNQAARNVDLNLKYKVKAVTRYEECFAFEQECSDKTDHMTLPDELDEDDRWDSMDFTFDILPDNLDDLWTWYAIQNYDEDGDDLETRIEAKIDSDNDGLRNDKDWDSDNDGLADGFERNTYEDSGAYYLTADSDGDDLSDGLENILGTIINDDDSDDDGLLDGAEVFHWDGAQWTGGGWFIDIDGSNYWVFANPFLDDFDGDGLTDATEKNAASSPNAANTAPDLSLTAGPYLLSPTGAAGVYAANNDTITATVDLQNFAGTAVTTTLSFCPPNALNSINVTDSGDSSPTVSQSGGCYEYDFSSDPLLFFETWQLNMTATATGSTVADSFDVTLPYTIVGTQSPISNTIAYQQDNTIPAIQLTDPYSGTILTGDFYVMGGFSEDSDSWVDQVLVTVPAGTFPADNTSPWAYTWDLPNEGVVTVSAVAYDIVGNASTPASIEVTVDSLAPVITSDFPPNTTLGPGQSYSDTITISGTATDNYAGLTRVQLRNNERPWRTIWSTDTEPLNVNWSGVWELPAITSKAQGKHTLELRAFDAYGNIGHLEQTVFVDLVPPTSELTNRTFTQEEPPHVPINQLLTLYGVANDAGNNPLPADPVDLTGNLHSIEDATIWFQPDNYAADDGGVTVSWIGDFNGDRLNDLAIGLPADADGAGKVTIVPGAAGDWAIPNIGEMEFLSMYQPSYIGESSAGLGTAVQPGGDFNGDGFEEMLIGDPANGRLFLIYGTASEFGTDRLLDGQQSGRWTVITTTTEINTSGAAITAQFAATGDVNNDSYGDILVSITEPSSGAVYLLLGGNTPQQTVVPSSVAGATFATSSIGASVAGVGDVNGDFIADFAISSGGTVYLFAGGGGWVEGGKTTLTPANALATFPTSDPLPTIMSNGDMNGDNIDDFVYSDGSAPVVVYGHASASFSTQTLGGFPSALSGFLAAVGDVDKDGQGDLLIGNADDDAYLLLGGNLSTVAATIEGVASAAPAPDILGGDLTGDGSSDLLLVPSSSTIVGFANQSMVQAPFINPSALPTLIAKAESGNRANGRSPVSGDVTVGFNGADYTSIQAAIDSGADRVLIEPGIYQEVITLTNNIVVAGSGPSLTYLTFPDDSSGTVLVNIDGTSGSTLRNITFLGTGTETGISAINGATNITLTRSIVRDMATAVLVDGNITRLDLVNNSLIGNGNAFQATNCASFDIVNTIFAYNTGTALQKQGCGNVERHEFNLYWANGTDQSPNDPSGGELFSDPLFIDYAVNDFRTESYSPVVDAGATGIPVPPGAGDFADIGHMEQTGASFFTSQSYCATCANDGLTWSVDAFNTIQGAVDAAQSDIAVLSEGTGTPFAVGVDSGIFSESVVISYSLRLLGSDPDKSTIQGIGGPAVTLQATIGSEVSDFTLTGGGATPVGVQVTGGSNSVLIKSNLIKDNEDGIVVNGRSSGQAQLNTIISNTTGINIDNQYNWLDSDSNIISGNTNGLVATNTAALFSDYSLLNNGVNYTGVITGPNDLLDLDPLLTGAFGYLQLGSPAIDTAALDIPAPTGGGGRADMGWHELLVPPISIFMGQPDDSIATESIGVGQVEYAIVATPAITTPIDASLPSSWSTATLSDPGEKLTYWEVMHTPTITGYYRIYSRATDDLGNAETDVADWYEGGFVVDDTPPVITYFDVSIIPGQFSTWAMLTAEVYDYIGSSFDVEDIYFEIDGERVKGLWIIDEWQEDGVSSRRFHYIFMNDIGDQTFAMQAFAMDGAGQVGSSAVINQFVNYEPVNSYYDATPPSLEYVTISDDLLPIPPFDEILGGTVTILGGAFDRKSNLSGPPFEGRSRVNGFEFSFDGGLSWEPVKIATYNYSGTGLREFIYTATVAVDFPNLDATTIPIKIRTTDNVGLSRVEVVTMTIDTEGPRFAGPVMVESDLPAGSHQDDSTNVTFSWMPLTDGSGSLQMLYFGGNSGGEGFPAFPISGSSWSDVISGLGDWYGHVGAEDDAGNRNQVIFGPWYLGQVYGVPWDAGGAWQSFDSTLDGFLDLAHNEWLTATEWLDNDERPNEAQSLYTTWDSHHTYIGWQGANWDSDGTLWLYWDLSTGGTAIPVTGTETLPFDADKAIQVIDNASLQIWSYNGANWVTDAAGYQYAYSQGNDTNSLEIQYAIAPWPDHTAAFDHHRFFAYAVDDANAVWTAFPTNNELSGDFIYYYEWDVTTGTDLLQLPTASQQPFVEIVATSNPPVQDTRTHNSTIDYIVSLTNLETQGATNVQMVLTGTNGINYQTVSGATCTNCAANDNWILDVPTIAVDTSHVVTVTTQLDSDLTGNTAVTTTIQLLTDLPLQQRDVLVHVLDLTAPTVYVTKNPGNVIGIGAQTITGVADDGPGTGVELVEVSEDGSNWQLAEGTQSWSGEFNILASRASAATWQFYARATDYHGQTSSTTAVIFNIDTDSPLITATVPALLGSDRVAILQGTTKDQGPIGAEVQRIEIQQDNETANWRVASLYAADANGQQSWAFAWLLPNEDGIGHAIRFRATDYAGNVTITPWYATVVDRVKPVITISETNRLILDDGSQIALSGSVSDGGGVANVSITVYDSLGGATVLPVSLVGDQWSFTPTLNPGDYSMLVQATDNAGNVASLGVGTFTVLPTDPVAHWAFDVISGTVAPDSSGNGHHGTLVGTPTYTSDVPSLLGGGMALSFDDSSEIVTVPDHEDINLADEYPYRTVTAWFNVNDKNLSDKQVIWEEGGSTNGINLYIYDGAFYGGAWSNNSGWSGTWISSTTVTTDTWHHAAVVISGTASLAPQTLFVYLDGQLIGQADGTQVNKHSDDGGIGRTNGQTKFHDGNVTLNGHPFGGIIDDVRVYNRGLSAQELVNLAGILTLSGELLGSNNLTLNWGDAGYDSYELWGSTIPYSGYSFLVDIPSGTSYTTTVPIDNTYYELYGVINGTNVPAINRVGIFHFTLVPGN